MASETAISRPQHVPRLKKKPGGVNYKTSQPSQRVSTTDVQIHKYSGLLQGQNSVIVTSPPDISALVKNGCFGKGMFSRSAPTHAQHFPQSRDERRQKQRYGVEKVEVLEQREISQRKRLKLHSQWKEEQEMHHHHSKELQKADQTSLSTSTNTATGSKQTMEKTLSSSYQSSDQTECFEGSSFRDEYHRFAERMRQLAEEDAYPITEYLQLSSEEAFYLVHELGVLDIFSSEEKQRTAPELWNHFCKGDQRFVERYIAYQYFRKQGWVPKSGLKFGVDFLLYKEGPAVYHSSYAVIVKVTERLLAQKCFDATTDLTWQEMISLCRVNESAVKDLMVSYVIKPENFSEGNLDCLSEFEVREVFVSRWVPDRERKLN